ncbi:hypothetical protein [Alkalimarinus coralli]|nr:hypothetical protein [Alkalimarinus coralli]
MKTINQDAAIIRLYIFQNDFLNQVIIDMRLRKDVGQGDCYARELP